jgi:hypothetical protein
MQCLINSFLVNQASNDGHFRDAEGDAYEGEGMLRSLIQEIKDQLLLLEEKDEDEE